MADTLPAFLEAATALLGPRGISCDAELMAPWLSDWRGRYHGAALAMASPANAAELAGLVRLCAAHGIPLVPQGGNSGMSGGATPGADGRAVLVSLRRMNKIRNLDPAAMSVECEAGVVLQELHDAAAGAGLRFPLTLGGKGSATVGGLIATNAGGNQVLRFGPMRAQVLGLEAVLASGELWSALAPLKKDNRGFDLKQLFIGSEGTLGIITAATLRLVPLADGRVVIWAGLQSIQAARALLLKFEKELGQALESFEVVPANCLDAVLDYLPSARAPLAGKHAWHALIELGGADHQAAAEALLARELSAGTLTDAIIAQSEAQAEALWQLRESISPALRGKGAAMQHDIAVPVARMADFIDAAIPAIEAQFPGTSAFGFGHLGDGNVHFHVVGPQNAVRGEWENGDGKAVSRAVHDLVTAWHGTISAEHGIGQMKRAELERTADPVSLALMRRVKAALDPAELFNPGKLVTLAPGEPSA